MNFDGSVGVVGGGIIGSWAALHLAEAGVYTTLFEQFPLPHTRGSSHGLSRAFRFLGELEQLGSTIIALHTITVLFH